MFGHLVLWSVTELLLFVIGVGLLVGVLVWFFLSRRMKETPCSPPDEDIWPDGDMPSDEAAGGICADSAVTAVIPEEHYTEPECAAETINMPAAKETAFAPEKANSVTEGSTALMEEAFEEDFPEEDALQETQKTTRWEMLREKCRRRRREAAAEAEETPDSREQLRRMEQLVQFQRQTISSLEKQVEDAARMRHDFRRELLALKEFARSGEREAIERYLPEIHLEKQTLRMSLCANPLVNVLLQYYMEQGRSKNVEMDISVEASEKLWLDAADLSVLLSNLLENGVVASAEAPEGQRRLRLRTMETEDLFAIVMGNTFGSPRSPMGTTFVSTKADHKGIGLDSIRRIAERFGGEATFYVEDTLFMSCIALIRPMEMPQSAER